MQARPGCGFGSSFAQTDLARHSVGGSRDRCWHGIPGKEGGTRDGSQQGASDRCGNSRSGWGRHSSHRWHRAHTSLVGRQCTWSRDHGNSRSGCRRHSSHRWHRAHTTLVGSRQWTRTTGTPEAGAVGTAVTGGTKLTPSAWLAGSRPGTVAGTPEGGVGTALTGGTELTPAWLAPGTAVATPEVGAVGGTGGLAEAGRPCTLASLQDASSGFSDPWPCMARLQQIQRSTALLQLSTSDYIYS